MGGDPNPAVLVVTSSGTQVVAPFQLPFPDGVWLPFSGEWNSGTHTSATLRIVDINTERFGNDFALDDLGFSIVPEPATLLGLASGIGILFARPRRRCR
jgi:hypothetical protein